MRFVGLSLLALLSVSTAAELRVLGFGEGVFNKRQDTTAVSSNNNSPPASTGGNSPAPSSSNNDDEPSSAAPSSNPNTPTPTPPPSSNPTSNGNGGSSSAPPSSAQTSAPSSSNNDDSSSATEEPSTVVTPFTSDFTQQFTRTIRTTLTDGQETDTVITETSVSQVTGVATSVVSPVGDQNNSGSGGLSDTNKKVIGGVVGGVGGALLLGGLALVFLRLRKKKQAAPIEDDYAGMDYKAGPNNHGAPLNNQFQTTLDQYHNPPPRPNAAANF